MATDWYPKSMDARAAWHENFATQLPALAAKYNILAPILAEVGADNAWMQYWVDARHEADAQSQQLTRFFNDISGKDENLPPPAPINWSLSGAPPTQVKPGIEFRTREIARQIKGSMAYAEADGDLLGIVTSGTASMPLPPGEQVSPDFTLVTLAEFALQATFRKLGNDAVRFQYRHKGGNWIAAGVLINSPGSFTIAPQTPGTAEQIEVRGIFLLGNAEVGVFSDAKPAFIAP